MLSSISCLILLVIKQYIYTFPVFKLLEKYATAETHISGGVTVCIYNVYIFFLKTVVGDGILVILEFILWLC